MKSLSLPVITLMMTITLYAADITGTWKGSMETQIGTMELTITIQPGAPLAGKFQAGEYEGAIENSKVNGDKFSFEVNMSHGQISCEGTVEGDEMKLNITGSQGDKYAITCKRQK